LARQEASGPVRPVCALDEVAASIAADRSARHWIRSEVLSPQVEPREIRRTDDLGKLSFSGLIAIRVTDNFSGRQRGAARGRSRALPGGSPRGVSRWEV
jgi:hypothetical protein